jgi:hypothetical protein
LDTDANSSVPPNIVTANKISSRLLNNKKESPKQANNTDSRPRPFESILNGKTRNCPYRKKRLNLMNFKFLKNPGRETKEWIVSFFNDIFSTLKLPKVFKRATKPGKYGI